MSSSLLVPKIVRNMFKRCKKRNPGDTGLEAAAMDDTSAMGRHDWIPSINNVEDIHYRIALALSRVDTKENQFVDCEATPASDYRALPTSTTNNNNNETLSAMYHVHGVLEHEDRIENGFYDVWGEFPEVCNPGSFPSLKPLKKLRLEDDDLREVVLFTSTRDSIFPLLEEAAHRAMLHLMPQGRIACIQGLAQIVAAQLGGAASEERLLYKQWQKSSERVKRKFKSVVYPIGKLRVGLSRHRAFLFKALADRMHISCRLVRGPPYRPSPVQAVSLVRFADLELIVDLICQPGRLLKLEDGGPKDKVREVVFAEAPPLPSEPYWLPMHSRRSTKNQSPLDATNASSSIAQSWPLTNSSPDLMNNSRTQGLGHSNVSPVQVPSSAFGEVKTPFDPPSPPHPTSHPKQALEFSSKGSAMMTCDPCDDSVAWSSQAVHGSMNRQCSSNSALSGRSWNDEVESTPAVKSQQQSFANRLKTNYEIPEEQSILSSSQKPLEQDNGSKCSPKPDPGTPGVPIFTLGVRSPFQGFELPIFDDGEEGQDRRSVSLRQDPQDSAFGSNLDWAASTFDPALALVGTTDTSLYDDCTIPASEIRLESPRLAVGSYGEVFKGTWNGTDVAVKKLLEQDVSPVVMEEFLSEVKIMKRLRHPNVLLFMGVCMQPPNLAIVTEFLPRGSLYKLLHKTSFNDDRLKLRMAKDVVKGMCYLHSHKPAIVHRDLKSPNLLVDKDWTVKVCDFGMSKMKANTYLSGQSQGGGTPEWMAPEVLRYESSDEKCDVYSFGVILYELVTGLPPWRNLKPMQVVGVVGYEGKQLPLPQEIDPSIASIIQQCWSPNSRNRPSFQELLGMLSQFETLPCIPRPTTL